MEIYFKSLFKKSKLFKNAKTRTKKKQTLTDSDKKQKSVQLFNKFNSTRFHLPLNRMLLVNYKLVQIHQTIEYIVKKIFDYRTKFLSSWKNHENKM